MDDVFTFAKAIERDLGLREGFVESLEEEDDWSFVIKLHAVLEATVAHSVTQHLKEEKLQGVFARLPLSDKSTGKLEFAKALGIFDKSMRRFVSTFSEIRNSLIHDVRQVGFSFAVWLDQMSAEELAKMARNLSFWIPADGIFFREQQLTSAEFLRKYTKLALISSAISVLAVAYMNKTVTQAVDNVLKEYTRLGIEIARKAKGEAPAR